MAINVPIVSSFDPRGVNSAERRLDGFGRDVRAGLGRIGDAARIAAAAVAGIAAGAAAGAWKAIGAASDIAEATSKVEVIFGDASAAVLDFSKTAAGSFGLSRQAVLDAAGTFGTFGKAAGLAGSDLSGFTTDFVGLSADLASFGNTTPEEAIAAIGAALRGENEPIRRYGVLLDDARLKARALELGIYDGAGALTAQQKILAAQAEIYAQTGDAQGDFARTSDGLANQQRILKANLSNVVAEIGTSLLPVALKIAQFVNDRVVPAIQRFVDIFQEEGFAGIGKRLGGFLKDSIPKVLETLGQLGSAFVDWIRPRIRPMLSRLLELLRAAADWIYTVGYPWLVDRLIVWGDAFVDWIRPQIRPALEKLGELLVELGNWILDVAVPTLKAQAEKLAPKLWEWIKEVWPELQKGLAKLLLDLSVWLVTDGIPKMQKLGADLAVAILRGLWAVLRDINAGAAGLARQVVNAVIRFINEKVIRKLNDALQFEIFGITINPPDIPPIPLLGGSDGGGGGGLAIPKLAKGGIVTAPTLALIGEAGPEAVVPLDRYDTGRSVVINISGALDPVGVARQIRRLLNDDATRAGRKAFV